MAMERRSMVARGWERVLITKGHVETFGGSRNILLFSENAQGWMKMLKIHC